MARAGEGHGPILASTVRFPWGQRPTDKIPAMSSLPLDPDALLARARATFDIEAAAVLGLKARLGDAFVDAVRRILEVRGRVVVMGMGKSGHVGRKIAATLASTGTPAMFVHPAEASHGDLGMITTDDVIVALSWSGETVELHDIVDYSRRFDVPLIAFTSNTESALASSASVLLVAQSGFGLEEIKAMLYGDLIVSSPRDRWVLLLTGVPSLAVSCWPT